MGDGRIPHSVGFERRRYLFCLFTVSVFVFVFSWFFFLQSAGSPHFIEHGFLPDKKLFSVVDNFKSTPRDLSKEHHESPPTIATIQDEVKEQPSACEPNKTTLKVFMYDLPSEFHFGLLGWKGTDSVWPDISNGVPDYPGGLNLQHSTEYWLTLDLLSSRFSNRRGPCNAVRVDNSSKADIIFVPFFSSLSYNRYSKVNPKEKVSLNRALQDKLVAYLRVQHEWKRSGGRDHVILAHHPNSMLDARMKLWPCMFILSDFGRYPPNVANIDKDIIAPYKHVIRNYDNDSSTFDSRPILLYFQGAIYRKDGGYIRQELYYILKDEKDVHFSFGSIRGGGINQATKGMHSSKFCLNIAGDTPSSNRLFDAIASHCVPVIISDEIELPYEDVLDYSEFCIFVRTSDALKEGFLIKLVRSITKEEWMKMWERLKEIEHHFEYQYPSQGDDAVQMIWKAVSRKVPSIRLKLNRSNRFRRSMVQMP
ncbi:probable arabinosyltransferase ARAD1 isoform X1 [Nymphaea colorata]|nr:probable arabinosyltransferase ARAD1 isoform X1 [Nymphaea colorata]XP_031497343.1 probable arabinosyltransferase ARAD1 isoform X1 [Nymphaea colorata]XP_031497351.1 probable arabinosyltransferase ARAD1 isoform X1 [Nymphaea colorata]XP_049936304.1 probable arabinosyltransferase ARAD1 isoform X1 [Nymphaea colorata]XP_049936307.1 probable arabinosyltransferase ARAD1 isoform X1 [Nymphaea colorata]